MSTLSKLFKRNTRAISTVAAGAAAGSSAGDIAQQLLAQQRARLLPTTATQRVAAAAGRPIGQGMMLPGLLGAGSVAMFVARKPTIGALLAGGALLTWWMQARAAAPDPGGS